MLYNLGIPRSSSFKVCQTMDASATQAPAAGSADLADAASDAADRGSETPEDVDDLKDAYEPPSHITAGHVYSNAYRKSMKLKQDKEEAKVDAKKASRIFQTHGLVTPLLCGKFADKPRKRKAPSAAGAPDEAQAAEPADVAEDWEAEQAVVAE